MSSVYLHDIPLPEAQTRIRAALEGTNLWRVLGAESIALDEGALGRVLAEPIWAKVSSPHYHASAMDGFAVRAKDTLSAEPSQPLTLFAEQAQYLDTGDPLPEWADAVIPVENTEALDASGRITSDLRAPHAIRIRAAVPPWSHIRPLGEDIIATQLVLPAGQVLRAVDLGAIAAAGHDRVEVSRRPRVAILPTGTELVPIGSKLKVGDILEYNSLVLSAQVKAMGGAATRYPITRDDLELICSRVQEAAREHDLILLNAGSSAGEEDFSAKVIERLGTLLIHGVAVRPGHPVIFGMLNSEKLEVHTSPKEAPRFDRTAAIPIFGVPGYPVSAALTAEIFVEPVLAKWLGRHPAEPAIETAQLTRKITSPAGDDDFVRVALGRVGERLLAAPLARGAGVITSLVQADGLAVLPRGVQGAEAGDKVSVRLYRSRAEIERTIFCIGSHDLTLDLLAQFLAGKERRLVSANVGSQGGLIALGRGEAHVAGSHLLDPDSGEFNLTYIRRYAPGLPVKAVALVRRDQGLLVKRGNPKQVRGLQDLIRPGVRFINRQRGAGTRVLLDYHLGLEGVVGDQILGYNQEEYTHLGVAVAVASGRADCGLGIAAAAQALDLEFIPLFQERFDLVMSLQHARGELLRPLFELLGSGEFRVAVSRLQGYDVAVMGTTILED
jgi:putative molybdopterin biosynthesis protein